MTMTMTPTPALQRLTTGGCCTQPFWSPDSQQVLFIDQPPPDAPLGIWGVSLNPPDATPALLTQRVAFYSRDLTYVVEYGRKLQARAAEELALLPRGSAVAEMLSDYAVMREQARACAP